MRILLSPDAGDGGEAGTSTGTQTQTGTQEPPKTDPAAAAAQAELAKTRARLAELEEAEQKRAEAARKAEEEKLANKGEYEKLIKARDADLEKERTEKAAEAKRARNFARDTALALAIGKHPVLEGKSEQLLKLWREDFEAVPDGEGYRFQTKDFKSLDQVVAERLASPEYDHYVKASSQGGGGASGGGRSGPTPKPGEQEKPKTLLEAAKEKLQGQRIHGFGLKPRRK